MMAGDEKKIIIEGITEQGETFRPSDWADRMSGQLATFPQKRVVYSPLLQPSRTEKGLPCVILDPELKETNPTLYHSILAFAQANRLKICGQIDDSLGDPSADLTERGSGSGSGSGDGQ